MADLLLSNPPLVPADASQPARPAELRFHLLLLVAAVAVGSFLQVFGPAWSRAIIEQVRLDSIIGILVLVLAVLASVMAHESGHFSAALAADYEILGGALGPLQFDYWNKRCIVRFRAGQWSRCSISAVPRHMDADWRVRMMWVVVAGPLASLLFLLLAGLMAMRSSAPFWSACTEVNFFLVILGLIPNSPIAPVRNDAALFLALWQNERDAQDIFRCHQAIELSLRPVRPQDFPQPLLAELAGFTEGRAYTRWVVARRMVEWAFDSGHFHLATAWDRAALAAALRCGPHMANNALAESACLDLLVRSDRRSASRKFARVQFAQLFPPSLAERARAACLLVNDSPQKAPAHILRAQYSLPLGNPYYDFDRTLLERLHSLALAEGAPTTCGRC